MIEKDIENRWFPPSPHKEAVLEFLSKGRAHIEERGHNIPPLLVFEDGGVMELPRVRYKNGQFSPDESSPVSRQTNYNDVCGTIDEFKKILENQPEKSERLVELLDDVCYLLSRMQRRRENYKQAVDAVGSVYEGLKAIEGPDVIDAYQKADKLRELINITPSQIKDKLDELFILAEGIRDVANRMEEEVLYPYRDLFIELGKIYSQIKGSRSWATK
ncbi:MAG: hypothetical protein ACUVWN_02325 [bacterium]